MFFQPSRSFQSFLLSCSLDFLDLFLQFSCRLFLLLPLILKSILFIPLEDATVLIIQVHNGFSKCPPFILKVGVFFAFLIVLSFLNCDFPESFLASPNFLLIVIKFPTQFLSIILILTFFLPVLRFLFRFEACFSDFLFLNPP